MKKWPTSCWPSIGYQLMVSRTEIAVMSDERKVSIGRITSKRSRGSEREREREEGRQRDRMMD